MGHFAKYCAALVGFVLIANALSYLLYGREQSLLLGADRTSLFDDFTGNDTLYLFVGEFYYPPNVQGYWDYDTVTVSKLADALRSSGKVVHIDSRPWPFPSESESGSDLIDWPHSGTASFDVSTRRHFPFRVSVMKGAWAPGFAIASEDEYFWLFGWHHLREGRAWIS